MTPRRWLACIGEDRTERLDIVPAQLRVIVTVRPKYACRVCEQGVTQALAPTHLIEGAIPSEGALAHVLVSKYADHLPLLRQSQMLARSGLDVHRSTLAGWVGKTAFHLRPLVECLAAELKTSASLGVDETPVRVLDPGRGKTKTGYLWTMARDERAWCGADPPGWSIGMRRAAAANRDHRRGSPYAASATPRPSAIHGPGSPAEHHNLRAEAGATPRMIGLVPTPAGAGTAHQIRIC